MLFGFKPLNGLHILNKIIKKFNRFSEHRAQEAEVAAVLAHQMLGRDYPAEKIQQAWTNTLFGHFHDILPGSNTHLSREYQSGLSQEALAITGLVKTNALRDIAAQINTAIPGIQHVDLSQSRLTGLAMGAGVGKGSATGGVSLVGHMNEGQSSVIIFNPTAWARKDVITTTLWDASYGTNLDELDTIDFIIRTSEGESFPAQKIGAGRFYSYHNYVDVSFPISVNALGYTTYVIEPTQSKFAHKETNVMDKTGPSEESLTLENDHLFIEFDHRTGGISKLVEKSTGIDMADSRNPLATLEFIIENGGNAWRLAKSRERTYPLYVQSMEKSLTGPYCEKVTAHIKLKESTIDVIYKLKTGQPFVEIDIEAMWLEIGSKEKGTPTLRIQFPFAVDNAIARYEIPYGSIERQLNAGEEVPGLRWADVAGIHRGTKQKVSYS